MDVFVCFAGFLSYLMTNIGSDTRMIHFKNCLGSISEDCRYDTSVSSNLKYRMAINGSIIKNLSSGDEEKLRAAVEASEKFMKWKENQTMTRTKYDKTLVNTEKKGSFEKEQGANEQEQFLKGLELDAKERAERRKKNEADAEILKSKGNKAFKCGRYQEAIDCYTEAIRLVKYFPAFYTNRAQAHIKLENYDAAIDDCKLAMRVDEKCVKAYVHCGRALQKKACFSEAILYFKKGEEIDPKQKDVIAGYVLQTENERQKCETERKVILRQKNDPSLQAVGDLMKNLGENMAKFKECIICVRRLGDLLENSNEGKTLFRASKGFDHFGPDTEFKRLWENSTAWVSAEHETFVCEMLNLGRTAVADNEYNVEELFNHEIVDAIHSLCDKCDIEKVHLASVKLLHQLTEFTMGRERILNYDQRNRYFLQKLLKFLEKRNELSKVVMGCINNLCLNEKFALKHSLEIEKVVLPIMQKCLIYQGDICNDLNLDVNNQLALLSSSFATLANLARIKEMRNRLQCSNSLWTLFIDVLTRYIDHINCTHICDMVYAELGLLMNLSTENSSNLQNHAMAIASSLLKLFASENTDLTKRVLGVLRLLMTYCEKVIHFACTEKLYEMLLKIIERTSNETIVSYGVKCLTLCTVKNQDAKAYVSINGLTVCHRLLSSDNETVIGNSALILSNCFEQGKACDQFVGTSIVKDLLTLATRHDLSDEVKQNIAIALAKLVKHDLRFLEQLRELHGLEILHSVIQSSSLL